MLGNKLREWLAHPLTHNIDIDAPQTTHLRRQIIQQKAPLHAIYDEWYLAISSRLPKKDGRILELGSGAGFMSKYIPSLITSEVFSCPDITAVLDGTCLPFQDHSISAIVMTDVLHHIPNTSLFFEEASRCIKVGGAIIMVEPWYTVWSKFIYTHFHHEPFLVNVSSWDIPKIGPLSGANGALPWIILNRDRLKFADEFPQWQINEIQLLGGLRYMFSGGVSMRLLLPEVVFGLLKKMDWWQAMLPYTAMFALIVINKVETSGQNIR